MKIVIDTNVIIDGIKDEYSYEKQILDAVIKGEIEAYANHGTISENKLIIRKLLNNTEYKQEMNDLFGQINMVTNRRQINIVRDPEDNKILESAVEAQADYLVTRDNDLLSLGSYEQIKIATPAEFWNRYIDDDNSRWKEWTAIFGG
ncbi:MAG: putative toxin-antitoxin system toxin component, PIN family [Candidatus Doudnabacteria bacterium]